MNLSGDPLPPHDKRDFIKQWLTPGKVIYIKCHFMDPPKDKYLVLLGVYSDRPLFFVVNSRINPRRCKDPAPLKADEHPFLDHDSYINCSEIKYNLTFDEITTQIQSDISRMKGTLSNNAIAELIEASENSEYLSDREKDIIMDAFPGS